MLRPFEPKAAEQVLGDVLWRAGMANVTELHGACQPGRVATAVASGLHGVASWLEGDRPAHRRAA